MSAKSSIKYTKTDEAPFLAAHSLLPIVQAFCAFVKVDIELKDISLAGRILAQFSECLTANQKVSDALTELGQLAQTHQANIVKLPNISASLSQLKSAITELQDKGFKIPSYPETLQNEADKQIKKKYAKVLGSAVNPVLREGNSDRRVAAPVKQYAKENPHKLGAWDKNSKTHVAHMKHGDFYGSEKSHVCVQPQTLTIELHTEAGNTVVLKEGLKVLKHEVLDASVMSVQKLRDYFAKEIQDAKDQSLLLSLHLKATMMKISDPIIFGHALEIYFSDLFKKFAKEFQSCGVNPRVGLADLYKKIKSLPQDIQDQILNAIEEQSSQGPRLAMVDSDRGITNFHVPSDMIVDASMPAAIKSSGKMWGPDGKLHDTKALIPDRCYAGIYQEVIDFCKSHGAFDVSTMGSVSNVGLMAKKAEEYGSHDKTFEIQDSGTVKVISDSHEIIFEHKVFKGDLWRMCQTQDIAIQDWIKLGVQRAKATGDPAVFWLDPKREHDKNLIQKVESSLKSLDLSDVHIHIKSPQQAMLFTLQRVHEGKNTISVTGNVLRDYLTDLFPILELGTSAKMLSIVPLLAGGGLYETGAGGSAPKHVQQFIEENHLRWDSLGEFLALTVSLEDLAKKTNNEKAEILAQCLDQANALFLRSNKSPSRKVNELDTRGSHFYLALFWAKYLGEQDQDAELKSKFLKIYSALSENEEKIVKELNEVQGVSVDLGGYYLPDENKVSKAMRPSPTLNAIIDKLI